MLIFYSIPVGVRFTGHAAVLGNFRMTGFALPNKAARAHSEHQLRSAIRLINGLSNPCYNAAGFADLTDNFAT